MKKLKYLLLSLPLLAPAVAFAQSSVNQGLNLPGLNVLFGSGLAQEKTLPYLIVNVIQLMLLFAGIIAVLFIIVGGFWYITSAGNEEQSEKGRKALTNAIIGIIIIVMSYAIISVVQNTVGGF